MIVHMAELLGEVGVDAHDITSFIVLQPKLSSQADNQPFVSIIHPSLYRMASGERRTVIRFCKRTCLPTRRPPHAKYATFLSPIVERAREGMRMSLSQCSSRVLLIVSSGSSRPKKCSLDFELLFCPLRMHVACMQGRSKSKKERERVLNFFLVGRESVG